MAITPLRPSNTPDSADSALGPGAFLREPPHNYEAEQALLGAILENNRAYEKVSEFLLAEHFADPSHRRIYEACSALIERGQLANAVTLKTYLEQDGALAEIGGMGYLARLAASVVTIINAQDYGRLIHDLHLRRALIALGEDVVNQAFSADIDSSASSQIETAEQRLFDLATTGRDERNLQEFRTALTLAITQAEAAFKRQGQLSGVSTGLRDLDKKLGGLHASDLIILAGRPSMGKTALATNIAYNAARLWTPPPADAPNRKALDGAAVAFFSLEMSAEQLATRILSEVTEISSHKIRQGEISTEEFQKLIPAAQELHRLPLFIDDTPALTVSAVRTRARRLLRQRQGDLGLIVIDYLQLLRAPQGSRSDNRVQEISDITRGLKALAKELNVPVLALSQLSRQVENRDDKRPQLSDLRESGSIEQDADVVMFVFREEYYLSRAEPIRRAEESDEKYQSRHDMWLQRCEEAHNVAEAIVGKQRHGPIGSVKLFFDGNYTKFGDLADPSHMPEMHD